MASSERPTAEFGDELQALVERAVDEEVSARAVEEVLQRAAQTARESRLVHEVLEYECPEPGCDSAHAEAVDRAITTCDVCYEPAPPTGHADRDAERILRFECPNGPHSVRCRTLDLDEIRCSAHDRLMELTGSHAAETDLGGDR